MDYSYLLLFSYLLDELNFINIEANTSRRDVEKAYDLLNTQDLIIKP